MKVNGSVENPEMPPNYRYIPPAPGEEVVISGIAGRFPECENVNMLRKNLLGKVDLVTDDDRRWKLHHPEIPHRTGKINDVTKFDALFFGVHFKQAHTMDPMCRMLLEHTYEAVIDAGVNPRQLRGTKTGVFIGACFSESEKTWFYEKLQVNGFGITGCSRAMFANRISYWLGIHGPSYTMDSACSSSLIALEHAYRAISTGLCDAAIVGGSNLCLHPYVSLQFSRLGVLSPDGRCKSFDADANGYTRSETIAVIFLQKAKNAKRVYATVVHGKTNCDGFKEQGITFPSSVIQSALFQEFYEECKVPTTSLGYLEAHGTGTKVGDPEEINAIDKVFCPGRKTPLWIGSVKSNLGHSEPASGLCSVAKVIVAMESGFIPPNLHYKRPREGAKALEEGRVKVVTEPTPWDGGYAAMNSFGFGGANAHILLKSHTKEKVNNGAPKDDLPRLVVTSGRTEEAVNAMLDSINNQAIDVEYIRLLHDIHAEDIPGHLYRGYTVAGKLVTGATIREVQNYPGAKRPIWFIFSGMGSQWPGMGKALMRLPVFARAIEKCDAVLRPRGVDIIDILTNRDKKTFDNILNSFVGIAAVQIGLVDLLSSIGIVPDSIIGHSVGELGCAYADGCFTAEEMVLSAYSRGLASIETELIFGSMAAVGLGYKDLKDMCPPDIEIACHNGPESSTISGPAESMKAFVAKLQANKIFAKEVPCSNIPYHSRYIAAAGPKLLAYLRQVIKEPKPRSQKWLSTSVPRAEWSTAAAKLSSAEYHTNNLLSPVLFEETALLIPKDAIAIEIAPHGLLQAILRRSLNPGVINIPLTQRGHMDNVEVFLKAVGSLYNNGLQPQVANLYPEVQYPVSRGTPMISPHIRWEHSEDWYVTSYKLQEKIMSGERNVKVTLSDETYEYMAGHVVDGRNLIPATGYLALIWETVGMMKGELYTELAVVFEDVRFHRATTIPKEGAVELTLMVQKGSGRFEVVEGGNAVVTGLIRVTSNIDNEKMNLDKVKKIDETEDEPMSKKDIYKELKLRGYHYSGHFRGLTSAAISGRKGTIDWVNNWVTFMDNMLQMHILGQKTRGLYIPTGIQKLVIDTKHHLQVLRNITDDEKKIPVHVYPQLNLIVAGGVEIHGTKANSIERRKPIGIPVLEQYKFVAHRDNAEVSLQDALRLSTHIAHENHQTIRVKTVELIHDEDVVQLDELASPLIIEILGDLPLIQADVILATSPNRFDEESLPRNLTVTEMKKLPADSSAMIAIGFGLLEKKRIESVKELLPILKESGYLLTRETTVDPTGIDYFKQFGLDCILEKSTAKEKILLFKKSERFPKRHVTVRANNDEFGWLEEVKEIMKEEAEKEIAGNLRLVIVGQTDFENGLLGFVNCLRREPGGEIVRAVLIQNPNAPEFSMANPLYRDQVQLDLLINVLREGNIWGSYRHLPLPPLKEKLSNHAWLHQTVKGDLSSLRWVEGPLRADCEDENYVRISYSALNFRDIMLATGKLSRDAVAKKISSEPPDDSVIGFEFSGITKDGRRVMGVLSNRGLANVCLKDAEFSWDIPDNWSLEDAATCSCVYTTACYALYINGQMKPGDKVLIHVGSGGVGQAAINLALYEGCEVFTTVGTAEKRKFIKETFPEIPDDHIGNSRDTSFEQMILDKTNGRGVDIVLNSLAEDKLQASVRCLADLGRFLEIGKFDLAANNTLGMECFLKEVSFHGIMLDNLINSPSRLKIILNSLVVDLLANGAIKPLNRTVFGKEEVETAFRHMAAGKHIGKVLLKIRDEADPLDAPALCYPRFYCEANKTYVIIGGLGGFGLELANWLVHRGAKNIVLTSRQGVRNGYQRARIALWKSYGANILVISGHDAWIRKDCEFILKAAADMGPVDAIFNLAVVLKDSICLNQTEDSFKELFKSKAWATKVLDEVSRKMCPQLRHFVVFSSVSCGRGNAGQTNYGMSNSVMERVCEKRVADGLPGLAIQWGAVGDVGLVADRQETDKELVIGGTLQQGILSCLEVLDQFMNQNVPIVCSMVVAEKRAGGAGALNVIDTVLNIMGLKDLKSVGHHTSFAELGMDSMMAVEIKQTLEREFEIFLTAQDIRNLNFAKLKEMAAKEAEQEHTRNPNKNKEVENLAGMKLLLQTIGVTDIVNDVCIDLPTKVEEGKREVFLIPGIEGFGTIYNTLIAHLRCPATCLQVGIDSSEQHTIDDMANYLLPHVLARMKGRRDFTIVGYSFGSLIAIELARKLEVEGCNGQLVLIDGSAEMMKAIKDQHLPSASEDELQSNVLLGMMDNLSPVTSAEMVVDLEKCTGWDQKVDLFISRLPPTELGIAAENQRAFCTAIYKRLIAIENYSSLSLPPIRTPIMLLKPTAHSVRNLSEDYGLKKVTRDRVEIHHVDGNHVTIMENYKVAAAINGDPLEDAQAFKAAIMEDGALITPITSEEHNRG